VTGKYLPARYTIGVRKVTQHYIGVQETLKYAGPSATSRSLRFVYYPTQAFNGTLGDQLQIAVPNYAEYVPLNNSDAGKLLCTLTPYSRYPDELGLPIPFKCKMVVSNSTGTYAYTLVAAQTLSYSAGTAYQVEIGIDFYGASQSVKYPPTALRSELRFTEYTSTPASDTLIVQMPYNLLPTATLNHFSLN
jgi:hypothetical protein